MATRNRKTAYSAIAIVLMALVGFGGLEIILRSTSTQRGNAAFLLGKRWYYLVPIGVPDEMPDVVVKPGAYRAYDQDLGWSIFPLGRGIEPNLEGKGNPAIYFSDQFGYRCDQKTHEQAVLEWADRVLPENDPSRYDYVCLGDSFTHGDAVLAEEAWPRRLAEALQASVVNLGVGGYGIDQAVMRYDTKNPSCDHVLLGLISGDLERATYLVYNFTYGDSKSKPIYEFDGTNASIFNRPVLHGEALLAEYRAGANSTFFSHARYTWDPGLMKRSMLDASYCMRTAKSISFWRADRSRPLIYQEDGARLDYCLRILAYLRDVAASRGAKTTIVFLGEANSFAQGADSWALLKKKLDALEIAWIDSSPALLSAFERDPASVVNAVDGVHYTPEANSRVAKIVAAALSGKE